MRRLAPVAAAGPVLFAVAAFVAPLLRPGHGIADESISSLAVGSYGWLQRSTFFALGLSSLVLAFGLRSTTVPTPSARAGSALVGVWGVGAILGGTYPADDTYRSVHGVIATVSFVAIAVGIILVGRGFAADRRWRAFTGPTKVLGMAAGLTGLLTAVTTASWFGISERLFIATVLCWLVAASRHLGRVTASPPVAAGGASRASR